MKFYESPDLRIAFDSGVAKLPASFQRQFERTLAAWVAQRKTDWKKPISELKYSLFLGFAIRDKGKPTRDSHDDAIMFDFNLVHSFAIPVSFSSLDRLDDVERVLKSMKFTTK